MVKKVRLERRVSKQERFKKWVNKNKILIQLNVFYLLIIIFIVCFMTLQ